MDHFFESLASLMSNLVRSTVENSIADMLDLLEEYFEGNAYTDTYDVFTTKLAHPQKIHPVKFFLVRTHTVSLINLVCFAVFLNIYSICNTDVGCGCVIIASLFCTVFAATS